MDAKYIFFFFVTIAVLMEVAGDIIFKSWSMNTQKLIFVLGLIIYTVATLFWAFALRYEYLSKSITVFTVLNLILVVLAGVFFFKEKLTWWNITGIVFGIIAVVLLEL